MLASRVAASHRPVCASCRLHASIAAKQFARSRKPITQRNFEPRRWIQFSRSLRQKAQDADDGIVVLKKEQPDGIRGDASERVLTPEQAAVEARKTFGDYLPEGFLGEEEYKIYERLYGKPLAFKEDVQEESEVVAEDEEGLGTGVLKEGADGQLEEVVFEELEHEEDAEEGGAVSEADEHLLRDIEASMKSENNDVDEEAAMEEEEEDFGTRRVHPLTAANRFGTFPATVYLPKSNLVEPIQRMLSGSSNTHLSQTAHKVFGGVGLPYSAATPSIAKTMQAKPIGLDAAQGRMGELEADVFMATLFPVVYASILSVLTETRKRLGTAWAEGLVEKASKNELRILDASGGAGLLAVREVLKAEWERMHEKSGSGTAVAHTTGKLGGESASPPLGQGTVLTGSDTLRKRASQLLENTTFIPRLPDYFHTETAKEKGKFDLVIAPHTLWPLREDHARKMHTLNLWSMLSTEGGVLLLLEKGVARGFELVATAREMLLDSRISSPLSSANDARIEDPDVDWEGEGLPTHQKEVASIIAPCTHHKACPMYVPKGKVKGRRDICHFSQRYIRPPFLQTILSARDKNFDDVKFSYLSVMRGKDIRTEHNVLQDQTATDKAFAGYTEETPDEVPSLSLPRNVLPPMKRRGHVIMDLCTPSGTLERWTVPRSFGREAFNDARKSSWGDLWALGAKTRISRRPVMGKFAKAALQSKEAGEGVVPRHERSKARKAEVGVKGDGGKMRSGRKVGGIRDKRDKTGLKGSARSEEE